MFIGLKVGVILSHLIYLISMGSGNGAGRSLKMYLPVW